MTEATDPAEPPEQVTEGAMADLLRRAGVGKVVITGLATDFWYVPFAISPVAAVYEILQ